MKGMSWRGEAGREEPGKKHWQCSVEGKRDGLLSRAELEGRSRRGEAGREEMGKKSWQRSVEGKGKGCAGRDVREGEWKG